jgi:NAD(P)-dependent dehydrogenase (short-subunit alcohol dehydrogenase family)
MNQVNEATRQRVALVTGASRGLGRETAIRLAADGIHVWLGVRDPSSAQPLLEQLRTSGGTADLIALDVTQAGDIEAAAHAIANRNGHLDILVNNAGVMLDGSWMGNNSTTVDLKTMQATFDTNFFGTVAVTQAMWPLLLQAGHANVVNVSSVMGSHTVHSDPSGPLAGVKPFAYDASKAALNAFTTHLADAGSALGVQVNSAHPGWVKTELGTEYAPLTIDEGVQTILDLALLPPASRTGQFEHLGQVLPW